jgi:hypothetical protein
MLVLDATTKSIKAVMSGAQATTNPDFTVAFADNTGTAFTEGANDGAFNGTSPVTIVAAPASETRRIIKSITIENRDTAAVTITLSYDNNGTLRTIAKVTLQVGDTWTTTGTFDTNGNLKQTMGIVNLATQVTGILAEANGGTGITSFGTGVATALGQNVTGSGGIALATSPAFTTPTLGAATATSINKVIFTAPATSATLTIVDGKTLTTNNSLTLAGTDATTMTFPSTSQTIAGLGAAQTFTAAQTFRAANAIRSEAASTQDAIVIAGRAGGTDSRAVTIVPTTLGANRTLTLPDATTTVVGTDVVQTLSGKTITGLIETNSALGTGSGTQTFNLSNGNYFTLTVNGTTTLAVSNTPSSGSVGAFVVQLTNGGSQTVNYFSGITWAAGTAPVLTASGTDVLAFFTTDGGTTWRGLVLALDIKAP